LHANSPEFIRRMHAHVKQPDAEHYSALEEVRKAAAQRSCAICWKCCRTGGAARGSESLESS